MSLLGYVSAIKRTWVASELGILLLGFIVAAVFASASLLGLEGLADVSLALLGVSVLAIGVIGARRARLLHVRVAEEIGRSTERMMGARPMQKGSSKAHVAENVSLLQGGCLSQITCASTSRGSS